MRDHHHGNRLTARGLHYRNPPKGASTAERQRLHAEKMARKAEATARREDEIRARRARHPVRVPANLSARHPDHGLTWPEHRERRAKRDAAEAGILSRLIHGRRGRTAP